MYLHEVIVRNFSIHRETVVTLTPITVLVGPNGSGKSAFFDALLNFSMLARGKLSEAFGGYPYSFAATRHRAASSISRIGYDVTLSSRRDDPERLRYKVDYSQVDKGGEGQPPRFEIHRETLDVAGTKVFDRDNPDASILKPALRYLAGDVGILGAVRRAALEQPANELPPFIVNSAKDVSRFNKFRLEPYNLRLPSPLPDLTAKEAPRLAYSGENVAGVLYFLKETGSAILPRIVDGLRKALPDFEDFDFNAVGTQRTDFAVRFSDQRRSITAARLSDGQLLVIGLMVLLHSPGRPPVLMIEEPENGLTPVVQRAVYAAVRALAFSDDADHSQVLISSHSPFVLCEAWNGEDRDFINQMKVESGQAVARRFSEAVEVQGIQLAKDEHGKRTRLSLRTAEEFMGGFLT